MEKKGPTLASLNTEPSKEKGNQQYTRENLKVISRDQQLLDQAFNYTRTFCGNLCGFSLLMLLCASSQNWVQFLVTSSGLELSAGLWTLCSHDLCWSHIPKPPYYLLYSRAAFIFSTLVILPAIFWLLMSCFPNTGSAMPSLDLKVSMLSLSSAICLIVCLRLFVTQVHWHAGNVMESEFLWAYYLSWCSGFLYIGVGIASFLNYITLSSSDPYQNIIVVPVEKTRLGIGPLPKPSSTKDKS